MAEYTYPGVYIEEKSYSQRVATSVSASVGAFIGLAPRGEVGKPVLVTSWTDFVNKFSYGLDSPYLKNAYLAYSVYGFFNNGGRTAYIVRVGNGTEQKASVEYIVDDTTSEPVLTFTAKDEGAWANRFYVQVEETAQGSEVYNVTIYRDDVVVESFFNLRLGATDNNFVGTINNDSKFVNVDTDASAFDSSALGSKKQLQGGADGSTIDEQDLVDALKAFDSVSPINLLVQPESQADTVISESLAYCENRKDCTFIADAKMNDTVESVKEFKESFNSEFGQMYFPWVEVLDPIGTINKTKFVPVGGFIAGAIARNDAERGIFKAPAGVEMNLRGAVGVKTLVNDSEQGILNTNGINVIRNFPETGIVIWGARTLANTYINHRREINYLMDVLKRNTKWIVFEPNNADLWRRIRTFVNGILAPRYQQGAYAGATSKEAYFIKCDEELNTPEVRRQGQVLIEVGVAMDTPGEFVVFRIGQWDGGSSAE